MDSGKRVGAVITFPDGLIGLEQYKEFTLEEVPGQERFHALRSTADPDFTLVVTRPFWFKPDYAFDLPDACAARLGDGPVDVYVTVTLASRPADITVNLLGPLVINHATARGMQVIADGPYTTRHKLLAGGA